MKDKIWLVNCLYHTDFTLIFFFDSRIDPVDIVKYYTRNYNFKSSDVTGRRGIPNYYHAYGKSRVSLKAIDRNDIGYSAEFTVVDYPVIDGYVTGKDKIHVYSMGYFTPFACAFDNSPVIQGRFKDLIRKNSHLDGLICQTETFVTVEKINSWKE